MIRDEDLVPGWLARIEQAQQQTHTLIGMRRVTRRPYGDEYPNQGPRCRDCAVHVGQLHVVGCVVERCPECGEQAVICSCHDDAEIARLDCAARRGRRGRAR